MLRKISCVLLLLLVGFLSAKGQGTAPPPLLLKNQFSVGGGLHNMGLFLNGYYVQNINLKNDRVYEFAISTFRSPKEYRINNSFIPNSRPYVYGKLNQVYTMRFGYGNRYLLFERSPVNGLEIRMITHAGLSLALLKPVYLQIVKTVNTPSGPQSTEVTERYDPTQHFPDRIIGSSGFSAGLSETSARPGAFLKAGFLFDWSRYNEEVRQIETGITLDIYPKAIPIMANEQNSAYFVSFYVGIQLGQKW